MAFTAERVRRHRASKPQGSSERVLPWQVTTDQLICASLSHTHYWYEVGMLKVLANTMNRLPNRVQRADAEIPRLRICLFYLQPWHGTGHDLRSCGACTTTRIPLAGRTVPCKHTWYGRASNTKKWGHKLPDIRTVCINIFRSCFSCHMTSGRPGSSEVPRNPLTRWEGACHYLTNRFQMEAPVAPSRSLQEASVGMAEAFSARDVFMKRS